jgi:hypothetical protein
MDTSLQNLINSAKQYITSETAMQSFMMLYNMLNDDEQVKFIKQLETKISELKK